MSSYIFSCPADSTDKTGMLKFLSEFDPIRKKYEFGQFQLTVKARAIASEFEEMQRFGNLTKHEFSHIRKNLELVYWDKDITQKDIIAYYRVEKKVIHQYLAIPQLDKLFDEDYFNFEWDMHVGQNFNEHRNEYYRDHFIHQIRDMYMMLVLLDDFGFYDASYEILTDREPVKISDYTHKKWQQFQRDQTLPQRLVLNKILKANEGGIGLQEDYARQYFFHYVINASAMLSALFHDMGYPICHFLETRHRISAYNPFMKIFTHYVTDSFDELEMKLSDSLLFTIVSTDEIKAALQSKEKGRYDHGVYSAIVFLLQFYENGLIFSLSPEKQCAIELAAVAIYNHTVEYDIVKYKEKNNYCWPLFRQNPISFLLRFCDDLQEWDRRYFEISSASDLIFCPTCGAPILEDLAEEKTRETDDSSKPKRRSNRYRCLCSGRVLPRPDIFVKRKLYLVTVADSVRIAVESTMNRADDKMLTVSIDYDFYKLLLLSNINNTYAKYRAKELYELKMLISNQDYSFQTNKKLSFRHIKLNYFMSANPLLIKLKILEGFMGKEGIWEFVIEGFEVNILQFLPEERIPETDKITDAFPFYINLLRDCQDRPYDIETFESYFEEIYREYFTGDLEYDNALRYLATDCFMQYKKEELSFDGNPFGSSDAYDSYCKPYIDKKDETRLYNAISLFTDQRSRCNRYSNADKKYISYYKDIYLFYLMNEEIKDRYSRMHKDLPLWPYPAGGI